MISLHSHSGQFCRHAKGALEDVVKEAIRQGFTVYGLSEHIPRYRTEDLYPEEADLPLEELEKTFDAYIAEATRLKHVYADQIELIVGIETESIIPDSLNHLERLLQKHASAISYIVGSVHHVSGIPIDFDKETFECALNSFKTNDDTGISQLDMLFCAYFDAQYDLMVACQPEVIGHFDLCRLYLPDSSFTTPEVWSKVQRNVAFGVGYGALFEVNAAAFRKGWKTAYPGEDVLQLIMSQGGRLTLSDDSHGPHAVGLHYSDAHAYLCAQGVKHLWGLSTTPSYHQNNLNDTTMASTNAQARNDTRAVELDGDWASHEYWTAQRVPS